MIRRKQRKPPKMQRLLVVVAALQSNIPSGPPECSMRESFTGTPNLRYAAETNGVPWIVDIYIGNFYRVQVDNQIGEVFRTIPALIGHLTHKLGLSAGQD
jgi:hypothetical protein